VIAPPFVYRFDFMRRFQQVSIRIRPRTWKALKRKVGEGEMSRTVRRLIQNHVGIDPDDSAHDSSPPKQKRGDAPVGASASSHDRDAPSVDDLRRMGRSESSEGAGAGGGAGGDGDSEERPDGDDTEVPWYEKPIF
jgi:hypothetical protein